MKQITHCHGVRLDPMFRTPDVPQSAGETDKKRDLKRLPELNYTREQACDFKFNCAESDLQATSGATASTNLLNIQIAVCVNDDILVKIREFAQSVIGNIKSKLFLRPLQEYPAYLVFGLLAGA